MNGGGDNRIPETEEELALAEVALERWDDYQERFVPIENKFMKDARATDADYGMNLDTMNTSVSKSMADTVKANNHSMSVAGAMPGSGKFNASNIKLASKHGMTVGEGMNESNLNVENRDLEGLQKVVSMGTGQANDAQLGFGQIANDAYSEAAAEKSAEIQQSAANLNAVGVAGGIALRNYKPTTTAET
ncbi:MAG: hypothetical protein OEX07_07675 [Gammaproteobacteria bacterium]|nr:hypothetical protein [Gammaproteobacteria bacterium]